MSTLNAVLFGMAIVWTPSLLLLLALFWRDLFCIAIVALICLAQPVRANDADDRRVSLIIDLAHQTVHLMSWCGVEPSRGTAVDIGTRMTDGTLDWDHYEVLILAVQTAESAGADKRSVCQKWNKVFEYVGAIK
jgi:hypothetical protein